MQGNLQFYRLQQYIQTAALSLHKVHGRLCFLTSAVYVFNLFSFFLVQFPLIPFISFFPQLLPHFLHFHYFCSFYFSFLLIFLFSHIHSTVPLTYLPAHLPSFLLISLISFLPSSAHSSFRLSRFSDFCDICCNSKRSCYSKQMSCKSLS